MSSRSSQRIAYASPRRSAIPVLVMLSVVSASYSLVQSMVNPALATLQSTLHTDQVGIGWVLTAYLLASAVFTPVLAKLGDGVGRRAVLIGALGLLVLGSVAAALATSLPLMIAGRVLQGAGGAVLPLAFGLLRDALPAARVGSAVGVVAAMSSVGGGIGVLVAGPIIESLGVPWLFWLPAIVNAILAIALFWTVPAGKPAHRSRVNWVAATLLSATLVCLLLPLSFGADLGWTSLTILLLFAGAVMSGVLWVIAETRSAVPLIDMTVFRMRPVWTANTASLLFGAVLYSTFGFIPSFLQVPALTGYGIGASITLSGLLFLPITLAMFITGVLAGPLIRVLSAKTVLIVGAVPPIVGFTFLALAHEHQWQVVLAVTISGLGFGIALSALSVIVVHSVPETDTGAAAGMNANIRTIGGAIGAAIVASILAGHEGASGFPTENGYTIVFATLAVASLMSLIACLVVPRAPRLETTVRTEVAGETRAAELLDQHNPF